MSILCFLECLASSSSALLSRPRRGEWTSSELRLCREDERGESLNFPAIPATEAPSTLYSDSELRTPHVIVKGRFSSFYIIGRNRSWYESMSSQGVQHKILQSTSSTPNCKNFGIFLPPKHHTVLYLQAFRFILRVTCFSKNWLAI